MSEDLVLICIKRIRNLNIKLESCLCLEVLMQRPGRTIWEPDHPLKCRALAASIHTILLPSRLTLTALVHNNHMQVLLLFWWTFVFFFHMFERGSTKTIVPNQSWFGWSSTQTSRSISSFLVLGLVGGLEHQFYFPINIGFLIIPIDDHIFQRGGPTTNQFDVWFWEGKDGIAAIDIALNLVPYLRGVRG